MRRLAWIAAGVLAAGAIFALASHGRRPDSGLARFEPAGVMVEIKLDRVREVVVAAGDRQWRFARAAGERWSASGSLKPPADWAGRVETGLRFLSVSAPQRVMRREEYAGTPLSEFGLEPPRYAIRVQASDAAPFEIEFGSANPQGLGQYARVADRTDVYLLPRFVGEQWEKATGLQ